MACASSSPSASSLGEQTSPAEEVQTQHKVYAPLSSKTEIRLFHLFRLDQNNGQSSKIRGRFHHEDLKTKPTYTALSYEWGPRLPMSAIEVELDTSGKAETVMIGPNLFDILSRLRKPDTDNVLWIDALCINQADKNEKTHQVGLMAQIYSKASQTIMWLGPESEDSDFAIEQAHSFEVYWAQGVSAMREHEATRGDALGPDSLVYQPLESLLERSYWSRLWIQQEVILSKNCKIQCGNSVCDWEPLAKTIMWMQRVPLDMEELLSQNEFYRMENAARLLAEAFFRKRRFGADLDLLEALVLGRERHATEPIDKVYGILSLCNTDQITADYQKTFPEVYETVAVHIIEKTRRLDVLSACKYYNPVQRRMFHSTFSFVEAAIRKKGKREKESKEERRYREAKGEDTEEVAREEKEREEVVRNRRNEFDDEIRSIASQCSDQQSESNSPNNGGKLIHGILAAEMASKMREFVKYLRSKRPVPSWVPVWSEFWDHRDFLAVKDLRNCHHRAAGDSDAEFHYDGSGLLQARGVTVDEIAVVPSASFCNNFFQRNESDPKSSTRDFFSEVQLHWSLVKDVFCETSKTPYGGEEGRFQAFLTCLYANDPNPSRTMREANPHPDAIKLVVHALGLRKLSDEELLALRTVDACRQSFLDIFVSILRKVYCRKLFITKEGYIGLGSPTTIAGDIVVVLCGAKTPFVLCPQEYGQYELKEECYVHGIMNGEILEAAKKGIRVFEDFTLV